MRASLVLLAAVAAAVCSGWPSPRPSPAAPAPAASRPPRLFKDSRQQIAIARAQGRREIALVVATVTGQTEAAAEETNRLGGDVRFRDDEVGYLRVRLPIDQATDFAESANVEAAAADCDDHFPMRLTAGREPFCQSPERERGGRALAAAPVADPPGSEVWPPRSGDYPLRHPYSPLKDIAAADLLAQTPTYDGRGVTIALLDGNPDLLLPEFQTAYTLDGKRVPKIADFLNVTDPRDDADLNPQWVNMMTEVEPDNGKITYQGKTFTVPGPFVYRRKYRIGLFDERRFNHPSNAAYIDQDVDRNGNPKGDDGLFGVLWHEGTGEVWVDTNRNLSFADEKPMMDYIKRQDVGVFGKDDPKTPVRESIGFAVQTDPVNKFVSINLGIYQHATEIMGSVVGNKEPGGRVAGVAPGARLVSIFYGVSNLHGALEGLIRAFRHPQVDLIVFEQSVAMASIPYLMADARHPISVIAHRLAARYDKLLFVPGSNSPGFGIVAEDGLAPNVVSVGGYQSRDSYRANWGALVEAYDNLHWGAMSHGPSGTGALKPDLIAPSGQISTDPGYRKGMFIKGLFQLPPGYSVDGGTSTATPMAAGAAALVLSAARQRGLHYDVARLKAALQGGARYIPRLAAHEQGAGLVQVGPALSLLEKLQSAQGVAVTSRAPVRTALGPLLSPPNEGVGLYEREGWRAGDKGEQSITLARTSGPEEPLTFRLRWVGNDGTFQSADSVELPLHQPVAVAVSIAVKDHGPHSAILLVEHPSLPCPAHRVLCTVVASVPLTAENRYTAKTAITVPKPSDRGVFVDVPPGTAALSFSASAPVRLSLISPDREQLNPGPFTPSAGPVAVPNPSPGVWEINVANNDVIALGAGGFGYDETVTEAPKPKKVTITATAVRAEVKAEPHAGWARADGAASFPLRVTNRLGAVPAATVTGGLGSAFRTRRTIRQGEQHLYEVIVPKGTRWLRAAVHVPDPNADLDLYLLDCTAGDKKPAKPYQRQKGGKAPAAPNPTGVPRAKAADRRPGGEVEVTDPAPGRWVVVVDAYSVPGGSTKYEYMDAFIHPRFGAVAVSETAEDRAAAAEWTVPAHAWFAGLPESPRVPYGRIEVTSPKATHMAMREDFSQYAVPTPLGGLNLFPAEAIGPPREDRRQR